MTFGTTLSLEEGDEMDIPQLQIQTTKGFLELQTTKPVQEIEQPRATVTQEQPAAILEMSTTKPRLSLDTTEARAEIDLKSVRRRIEEHAQNGRQALLEGIGRRAAEGQQMMKIENGGNVFAELSKQNQPRQYASLGMRFVGNKSGVKMSFEPGSVEIKATPQKPVLNVQVNKPIHTYTPGKVSGQMNPYPSIQIDVKW